MPEVQGQLLPTNVWGANGVVGLVTGDVFFFHFNCLLSWLLAFSASSTVTLVALGTLAWS